MGFFSKKGERKAKCALQKMGLDEKTDASEKREEGTMEQIQRIPVDRIGPNPRQPRRTFDEESLATLTESIKREGVLQPVIVKEDDDPEARHDYQLVAGERRWRAAKLAELEKIPAVVRTVADSEMRRLALIENVQREGLNVVEMTRSIGELAEEVGDTMSVAEGVGLSERSVQRYLRIYRVIYADRALTSLFERQAEQIDLKTALRLATLAESIMRSGRARELFDKANAMGIRDALKLMLRSLGDNKKPAEEGDLYNIAIRKNTLVFTVRYQKDREISPTDKRRIQKGLNTFFGKLKAHSNMFSEESEQAAG